MSSGGNGNRVARIAVAIFAGIAGIAAAATGTIHTIGVPAGGMTGLPVPVTAHGLLATSRVKFAETQRVSDQDRIALQTLARKDTLLHEPFAYLGFHALREGNTQEARSLLEIARDRRPRSRIARLALLEAYGQDGSISKAISELVPLMRLEPELVEPLAGEFIATLSSPAEVELLARLLANEPSILTQITEMAARSERTSPEMLSAFVQALPDQGGDNLRRARSRAMLALVERGEFAAARALWQDIFPNAPKPGALVFNGAMAKPQFLPPFDWDLVANDEGTAEWSASGGLYVDYYGRGASVFARQLLSLPSGRYRLAVTQSIDAAQGTRTGLAETGGLAWQVSCAANDEMITRQAVLDRDGASVERVFDIDADCPAQWLELVGRGELRRGDGQRILVREVALTRIAANEATGP